LMLLLVVFQGSHIPMIQIIIDKGSLSLVF